MNVIKVLKEENVGKRYVSEGGGICFGKELFKLMVTRRKNTRMY